MNPDKGVALSAPSFCTHPGAKYFNSTFQTLELFSFVIDVVLCSDYAAHVAKCVLDGGNFPKDLSPGDLAAKTPGPQTKRLREHSQLLLEMILSRAVDEFTTYLSEIIRAALTQKPEILKTRELLRLDYVLRFDSLGELTRELIDRKVADLSYRGFQDLLDWLNKKLGINIRSHAFKTESIVEIIETRNLIAHNGSRVGEKYLKKVPNTLFKPGHHRNIDVDYLFVSVQALTDFTKFLDETMANKFFLAYTSYERPRHGEDKKQQ
jgi:hypothetical protein